MANFVFNIAKGKAGQYFQNVEDNSPAGCAIVVVPIEASGVEADATLIDYDTLAAILAATNNEQTTMGRKDVVAAGLTITVDDTNNLLKVEMADQTWTAATGNAISDLCLCYDPTGSSADSALIPLTWHDFSATPNGGDITADVGANGVYQAS
jgi:hypothetical protein